MNTIAIITEVLARAPDWMRRDLTSNIAATKMQAEEALAGMIAAALNEKQVANPSE